MSSTPAPGGHGFQRRDGIPEAAAAIQPYRLVYIDGSNETAVLSDTAQANTQRHFPLGIFYGAGPLGGAAADGDKGLDIRTGSGCVVVAGTGGLVAGEEFVAEYSGTAASKGRAIGVDSADVIIHPGDVICGYVEVGASAGDYATVCFAPYKAKSAYRKEPLATGTITAHTLTAAELLGVKIAFDPAGGASTATTDTAANIIAAMTARGMDTNGDTFSVVITNVADASEVITLAAGSGVTIGNASASLAMAQNTAALLVFSRVSGSAVALTVLKGPNT